MTQLGYRAAPGEIGPPNFNVPGAWVITFRDLLPDDFEVWHIALRGPGGNFMVYIDDAFYSASDRGDINEYDPKWPMFVRRGQVITFHWSIPDPPAPQVWLYLRTPGLGIA